MPSRQTVLITGGAGWIGRHLTAYLQKTWSSSRIVTSSCNFLNEPAVEHLLQRTHPRVIFHCVGTTQPAAWSDLYDTHVTATAHLLVAASRCSASAPRIIILGSAAEYGQVPAARQPIRETEPLHPQTLYGLSKACQTSLALSFDPTGHLPVLIARLFNIITSDVPAHFSIGHFQQLLRAPATQKSVSVGPLNTERDFLSIQDVCRALALIARKGRTGNVYNVCSGQAVRMRDVWETMMRRRGRSLSYREDVLKNRRSDVMSCVGDPSKLMKETGWTPQESWENLL